jgi:hypothetical protein
LVLRVVCQVDAGDKIRLGRVLALKQGGCTRSHLKCVLLCPPCCMLCQVDGGGKIRLGRVLALKQGGCT